ncbi:F0F1 ATP synthase subunit epsilon [Actibacterium pelagium]|uniref:ATP synthase epsilon chain n=1 Tax=Actibacterium pelagium TaxID=2029103 RepID=A0A917ALI5_9RHOB|nr:F0F1 ATP synthase subunit epsilon [Actibacterium pelagium]GGE59474.1 ATP synthase epsilon chain 1 [Actibacterium pelagium]
MADTMQFDLVSPEKSLASAQVTEVQIPGAEGDLTAMPNHAPLITTLRPGVLKAAGPDGDMEYVVTGGFAEISAEGTSVLAERAYAVADMTADVLSTLLDEGKAALEAAPAEAKDALAKQVADLEAMGAKVGL